MVKSIEPDRFEKLIDEHLGFLAEEYGFRFAQQGPLSFTAETSDARLSIYMEHAVLIIELEPIGESAGALLRRNFIPTKLSILDVAQVLDPSVRYEVQMLDRRNFVVDVASELPRQAQLLRRYFGPLLGGVFTRWPEIVRAVSRNRKDSLSR